MMDKRLNDKGKNWRHVFKVCLLRTRGTVLTRQALTLLDYCLHAGSENVVVYFKDNIYIVK
jgi:epsin